MRRKTKKEIKRSYIGILIFAIFAILLGFLTIISLFVYTTAEYDELVETNASVECVERVWGRGVSYYLYTSDGEEYIISGTVEDSDFMEGFEKGAAVKIKWYENRIFNIRLTKVAEEITMSGDVVVSYRNCDAIEKPVSAVIGIFCVVVGICGILLYRFFVNHEISLMLKRDKRIQKKYGNKIT